MWGAAGIGERVNHHTLPIPTTRPDGGGNMSLFPDEFGMTVRMRITLQKL